MLPNMLMNDEYTTIILINEWPILTYAFNITHDTLLRTKLFPFLYHRILVECKVVRND